MGNQKRHITTQMIDYALGCTYEQLSKRAIEVEKHCINDIIACMMAATTLDMASVNVGKYAADTAGRCTILSSDIRVTAENAALANGALAHALDFDDGHDAIVHPTAVVFPALLALAEHLGGISGRDFVAAMVIGTDIACRIAMGPNEDLMKYGWYMPPLMSAVGAVFGAGRLARLSRQQILDTLAMTMTQFTCSAEAAVDKASVIRTIRDGFAAQAVVRSTLMAKHGIPAGFEFPLEGKFGYYNMYARDNADLERVVNNLGKTFETENITFKPWPSCKHTHTSINSLTDIMSENNLSADEIVEVHVKVFEACTMTLEPYESKCRPESPSIAKSSMPFVLGTVLAYGNVNVGSFTPERLADAAVLKNARKITYEVDSGFTKAQAHWVDMTVRTCRGDFTAHRENPMGGTGFPLSEKQVKEKFYSCCGLYRKAYGNEKITRLYEAIESIDEMADIKELAALF